MQAAGRIAKLLPHRWAHIRDACSSSEHCKTVYLDLKAKYETSD